MTNDLTSQTRNLEPGTRNLIIVGGGGFAREVIWLARECGEPWNVIGVLDGFTTETALSDVPVLGGDDVAAQHLDAWYVVAVGAPRLRYKIVQKLRALGVRNFATLVHPTVRHSEYVTFGEGSLICAGTILTTQITVGRHVILNLGVSVGHDTVFGDYSTVSPLAAVSGNVTLSEGAEIGTNATIIQGLTVSRGSLLGAGATLTKSLEATDVVAVGSPARALKNLDPFPALSEDNQA